MASSNSAPNIPGKLLGKVIVETALQDRSERTVWTVFSSAGDAQRHQVLEALLP